MSDDAAAPENNARPNVPPGAVSREIPIINKRGLHARASAKFVQTVERFNARGLPRAVPAAALSVLIDTD